MQRFLFYTLSLNQMQSSDVILHPVFNHIYQVSYFTFFYISLTPRSLTPRSNDFILHPASNRKSKDFKTFYAVLIPKAKPFILHHVPNLKWKYFYLTRVL